MTRHIHIEPVGGIAGDMFVSAMLDAFPENVDNCLRDLEETGVLKHVDVKLMPGLSKGLAAKQFKVQHLTDQPTRTGHYRDIRAFLETSGLDQHVKLRALNIFKLLAEAEGHVHGVDIEQVHFHEVADWDSITDIVAAASVIERARIESWSCSALPLGSGLVKTEHGLLPLPAPATAYLLRGLDVWDDGEAGERVTPTGAAILRYLLSDTSGNFAPVAARPAGTLHASGCGAGQRDLQKRPNITRCIVIDVSGTLANDHSMASAESVAKARSVGQSTDHVLELKFDIDDMTAEEMAISLEHIRACTGVTDVSYCVGVGKKGRSVYMITLLCNPSFEQTVCDLCFEETTTLGMRVQLIARRVLHRSLQRVTDGHGSAQVKVADRPLGSTAKVESDELSGISGLRARRLKASQLLQKTELPLP